MAGHSIARVINILEELLVGLDQAYWESSSIDRKDFFYDIISALHLELSELNKLSVQDHDLEWEPITKEFCDVRAKLNKLHSLLDEFVVRSSTLARLNVLIEDTVGLLLR